MSSEVSLRRCVAGDEAALALVGQATFLETFAGVLGGADILAHCAQAHAPGLYAQWLPAPGHALWLAEMAPGAAPVGYLVLAPAQLPLHDLEADDLEIKRIYLLDKLRGQGLGKRLITLAGEHARTVGARRLLLGVYAHNAAAMAFYTRMGFVQRGSRQFNVGGKDYDDIIFGLSL